MSAYQFDTQKRVGVAGEETLDAFFRQWRGLHIRPATDAEQRRGIDRMFTVAATGREVAVEYKTDYMAGRTGNAFVETVSVDRAGKPGWAVSSEAYFLIYLVPEPRTIYVIRMQDVRRRLPAWRQIYPERTVANDGYNTVGLLVPLDELERLAVEVYG